MFRKTVQRVFLVGCPRSGTTLLQTMLAAHPRMISFPESHCFVNVVPSVTWERRLRYASARALPRLRAFLMEVGREDLADRVPLTRCPLRKYAKLFVRALDDAALREKKDVWVEKTPDHIRAIPMISRYVGNARFIHLLRCGKDVVASLYDVTRRYPQTWGGPWTIDKCIEKWNTDVLCTRTVSETRNHLIVSYEALVERPKQELERICSFLSMEYSETMLTRRKEFAALFAADEDWKKDVRGDLEKGSARFLHVFDEQQRRYIASRLATICDLVARSTSSNCPSTFGRKDHRNTPDKPASNKTAE